jgi:hypothetical protein
MVTVLAIGMVVSFLRTGRARERLASPSTALASAASAPPSAAEHEPAAPEAKVDAESDLLAPGHVLVLSDPPSAHVIRAGADLGPTPVGVELHEGEQVRVDVQRDGYRQQSVVLDGASPAVKIKLVKVPVARTPASGEIPRTSRMGGVTVVNPWAH